MYFQRRQWFGIFGFLSAQMETMQQGRPFTKCWLPSSENNIASKCLKLSIRLFSKLRQKLSSFLSDIIVELVFKKKKKTVREMRHKCSRLLKSRLQFSVCDSIIDIDCFGSYSTLGSLIKSWNHNHTKSSSFFFFCWFKLEEEE